MDIELRQTTVSDLPYVLAAEADAENGQDDHEDALDCGGCADGLIGAVAGPGWGSAVPGASPDRQTRPSGIDDWALPRADS